MDLATRPRMSTLARGGLAAALAVFLLLALRSAWVAEDAFITLRTVDNLSHGHGPTWNAGERVQAFTHVSSVGQT